MPFYPVNNGSFELQTGYAALIQGPVYGWAKTTGADCGIYAPAIYHYTGGVPDGTQCMFFNAVGSQASHQRIPLKMVQGATYYLLVKAGWPKTGSFAPVPFAALFHTETGIALVTTDSPGSTLPMMVQDAFGQVIVPYTCDAAHAGGTLTLVIGSLSDNHLDLDDVQLWVVDDPAFDGNVVTLDERDPGASAIGGWTDFAQPVSSQYWNGGIRQASNPSREYQWLPTLPNAGRYRVSAFIPSATLLNTAVTYQIFNAGAMGQAVVDQSTNQTRWVELGEFDFEAGAVGYVQLSFATEALVQADAVAFQEVLTGGGAPDVSVAGVQALSGLGALAPTAIRNAAPLATGVQSVTGLGELSVQTVENPLVFIEGVQAIAGLGQLAARVAGQALDVSVSGVSAQALVGLLGVAAKPPILVSISGVSAQGVAGSLFADGDGWLPEFGANPVWMPEADNDGIWIDEPEPTTDWTEE